MTTGAEEIAPALGGAWLCHTKPQSAASSSSSSSEVSRFANERPFGPPPRAAARDDLSARRRERRSCRLVVWRQILIVLSYEAEARISPEGAAKARARTIDTWPLRVATRRDPRHSCTEGPEPDAKSGTGGSVSTAKATTRYQTGHDSLSLALTSRSSRTAALTSASQRRCRSTDHDPRRPGENATTFTASSLSITSRPTHSTGVLAVSSAAGAIASSW
mmetsp:Transcript_25823/g.103157  ORF Transcript_25823/g.103157 Transcript_25823/m.103157 type:complete len:219 (-) Transcript_25823:31-687(-)